MKRPWQQWMIVLSSYAAVVAFAMFQGSVVSSYVFYTVTIVFFYCIGLLLYPLRDIRMERTFSQVEAVVGQTMTLSFYVRRHVAWPLFSVTIEQDSSDGVHRLHRFPLFRCAWQQSLQVALPRRGEWRYAPIRLVIRDLFGFVEREIVVGEETIIVVYPQVTAIETALSLSLSGQGSHDRLSPFQQPSNVVTGIREYQRGDRFTWIDWKATARKDELVTKEFAQEQGEHDHFVIAETPSAHFEVFVSFVASYGVKMLQHGHQVTMDGQRYQSLSQQQPLLYQLAMLVEGKRPLAAKLPRSYSEEQLVVLTSCLSDELAALPVTTVIWFVYQRLTEEDEAAVAQWRQRYEVRLIQVGVKR